MMTDNEFIVKYGFEKSWIDKFLHDTDAMWVKTVNDSPCVEIRLLHLVGVEECRQWEAWIDDFCSTAPTAELAVRDAVSRIVKAADALKESFKE